MTTTRTPHGPVLTGPQRSRVPSAAEVALLGGESA